MYIVIKYGWIMQPMEPIEWVEMTIIYVTACTPPWPGLNDPARAGLCTC